jgi:uracil phosphoribosyltransferase
LPRNARDLAIFFLGTMLLTRREMFEVWRQGKTLQQKNLSVLKFVSSKLSVEEFTDDEEYNPIKKKT